MTKARYKTAIDAQLKTAPELQAPADVGKLRRVSGFGRSIIHHQAVLSGRQRSTFHLSRRRGSPSCSQIEVRESA